MSIKTISVEIRTPEASLLRGDYEFLVLPGYLGELGILPGHADLAATLKEGTIRLKRGDSTETCPITGGFAEIRPDQVLVFAEKTTAKK